MPQKYFILAPETPGSLGRKTKYKDPGLTDEIQEVQFVIEGWQGDHLVTAEPCYFVTRALEASLLQERYTGFEIGPVAVMKSREYQSLREPLPGFAWLKVTGRARVDDFGIDAKRDLVVSERALATIQKLDLRNCYVDDANAPLSFEERKRRIYLDGFKKMGLPPPPKLLGPD